VMSDKMSRQGKCEPKTEKKYIQRISNWNA
jgi:hypothetical protein